MKQLFLILLSIHLFISNDFFYSLLWVCVSVHVCVLRCAVWTRRGHRVLWGWVKVGCKLPAIGTRNETEVLHKAASALHLQGISPARLITVVILLAPQKKGTNSK